MATAPPVAPARHLHACRRCRPTGACCSCRPRVSAAAGVGTEPSLTETTWGEGLKYSQGPAREGALSSPGFGPARQNRVPVLAPPGTGCVTVGRSVTTVLSGPRLPSRCLEGSPPSVGPWQAPRTAVSLPLRLSLEQGHVSAGCSGRASGPQLLLSTGVCGVPRRGAGAFLSERFRGRDEAPQGLCV